MAARDYTDIVARFRERSDAQVLAEFIASQGVPCDLAEFSYDPRVLGCAIKVQRGLIEELRQLLSLKPVATGLSPMAAQILTSRLTQERIPCYIGGEATYRSGVFVVPLLATKEPGDMVAVPEAFFRDAMRIANQDPLSDEELTELALAALQEPKDLPES